MLVAVARKSYRKSGYAPIAITKINKTGYRTRRIARDAKENFLLTLKIVLNKTPQTITNRILGNVTIVGDLIIV